MPAVMTIAPENDVPNELLNVSKVGVIYSDARREYFPTEEQYLTEKDAYDDARLVANELTKLGISVVLIPGNDVIVEAIKNEKPEIIFNLVDSIKGNEYLSSTVPGILDMLDVKYTGAGLLGLALCYNKYLTKNLLRNSGVPVPNFQLFNTPNDPLNNDLRFPLFSKLNEIHGAVEINKNAVSENEKDLRERIKFLIDTYGQAVLVEEYIAGREITAMILQGVNTKVYMGEKIFNKPDDKYVFATFDDQWKDKEVDPVKSTYYYQKYEDNTLKDLVRRSFDITRMQDYGKFDVRLDESGRFYFIDVNLNPAFGPKECGTSMGHIIEGLHGISFSEILKRLIINVKTY